MQNLNEKKILGTVPKKLQLVETFWDCPEFSKKEQTTKGITLIALIITIIVMLILVGVTINVALNGGLFQKAETATAETKKELEKEELIQIAIGEYNVQAKTVDLDALKEKIASNYTEDTSKSVGGETLVVQGDSGTFWEINLETALVKEYEKTVTYNEIYIGTTQGVEISAVFYQDGTMNYSIPAMSVESNLNYTIKSTGSVNIEGTEKSFNNALYSNFHDLTDEELEFFGYFNEDFTTVTILAGGEVGEDGFRSAIWCECTLPQQ